MTPFTSKPGKAAFYWLLLALTALAASSLFAILLVVARSPLLAALAPQADFFRIALTLHVNLAVVVWFFSFAALFWSLAGGERNPGVAESAPALAACGFTAILISPLLGAGDPLLNNYLPVLRDPFFFLGLSLFTLGVLLSAIAPLSPPGTLTGGDAGDFLHWGAATSLFTTGAALVALLVNWAILPDALSRHAYYEVFFWSGGHLLQFTHTVLMLTAWGWLAHVGGIFPPLSVRTGRALFLVTGLPVLLFPLGYLHGPTSPEHREFFTLLMSHGTWLAIPIFAGAILWHLRGGAPSGDETARQARRHLFGSMLLFLAGILVGVLIDDDTLMVTAHYHGTVGAVTLAYMGVTRPLLAAFGRPLGSGFATRVVALAYGGGFLLLIFGLALSGRMGAPRKSTLADHAPSGGADMVGLTIMMAGGITALLATFFFLYAAFAALLAKRRES